MYLAPIYGYRVHFHEYLINTVNQRHSSYGLDNSSLLFSLETGLLIRSLPSMLPFKIFHISFCPLEQLLVNIEVIMVSISSFCGARSTWYISILSRKTEKKPSSAPSFSPTGIYKTALNFAMECSRQTFRSAHAMRVAE